MAFQSDTPPNPKLPLIMIAAGLLFMAGAVLMGLNLSKTSGETSSPIPTFAAQLPLVPTVAPATSLTLEIPRVSLEKARQAFDEKTAIFVDVRNAETYAADHIPGALSIPVTDLQSRLNELKTSDWIITYCT
jgi:hypothetical protein